MKKIATLTVAVLTGLMVFAVPALAEVSGIYQEAGADVGGVGGELISNVSDPAAAGGAVAQLAQTGFDLTVAALLAGALIALGAAAVMVARRRGVQA